MVVEGQDLEIVALVDDSLGIGLKLQGIRFAGTIGNLAIKLLDALSRVISSLLRDLMHLGIQKTKGAPYWGDSFKRYKASFSL